MEIGKTPTQYYEEQRAIGRDPSSGKSDVVEKPSLEVLRETLMKKEADGMEVRHIQGSGYEQVKITSGSSSEIDPRIGGSSIIFDSRLSQKPYEPPAMLSALAERPNQAKPAYEST